MTEQNGVERSSATEELRRMLDERGVEWWSEDDQEKPAYYFVTKWFANGCEQTYEEIPAIRSRSLKAYCVTPEQAIAATLGRGTCKLPEKGIDYYGNSEYHGITHWRKCSECCAEVLAYPARYCPNCGRKVVDE